MLKWSVKIDKIIFWVVKYYNFWHVWCECSKSHIVMGPCSCFAHDNTVWSNNYMTPIIKKKKKKIIWLQIKNFLSLRVR